MSNTTIGIKTADRTYVPILDKDGMSRKRLVLTTVKDDQENVQIDLYENEFDSLDSAQYIGSLLIEHIPKAPAGSAEVELIVGVDQDGTLDARATETASGDSQSLSVRLESLGSEGIYDIPEFELGTDLDSSDESVGESGSLDDEDGAQGRDAGFDDGLEDRSGFDDDYEPVGTDEQEAIVHRRRPVMLGLFIALGVAAIVLIGLLLFKLLQAPRIPELQARNENTQESAEAPQSESPSGGGPVGSDESDSTESDANPTDATPAASAASESPSPGSGAAVGGTWYRIRWGDTLWALSYSFYENPWLYPDIASRNQILDPDKIYAGSRIYIPSR